MRYFVYLLRSKVDNEFYIGYTSNIENRLEEHNSGKNKSTKHRIPFELVGYKSFDLEREARYREYYLKTHTSEKLRFIKKLMRI